MSSLRKALFSTGFFALAVLFIVPVGSRAGESNEDIQVNVSRQDETIIVHAQLSVPVSAQQAFAVLTDYDHMPQFLPGVKESRIMERTDNSLLVRQAGGVKLGPFVVPFDYVRRVELHPAIKLVSHVVSGSIKKADVTTSLKEDGGKTFITYDSEAATNVWLPFGIGTSVIAAHIRAELDSMRAEMRRRQGSGSAAQRER
jgi:carbon monoxide dehydrogenase subunit G